MAFDQMDEHKTVLKYCGAWICFEFAYLGATLLIHVSAKLVQEFFEHWFVFDANYLVAIVAGYLGVSSGLFVIQKFFKSVQARIIVLIYYVFIGLIMIIVLLAFFATGPIEKSEPSWMLVQTFVSVVVAWYLTNEKV